MESVSPGHQQLRSASLCERSFGAWKAALQMEDQASPAEGRPSLRLGLLPKAGWSLNPGTQCSPKNMMFIHEKTTKYIQRSQNIIENHGKTMPVFKTEFLSFSFIRRRFSPSHVAGGSMKVRKIWLSSRHRIASLPSIFGRLNQTWTPE